MTVSFDDIWTPDYQKPLPGRAVLQTVAERCGRVWEMPELAGSVRIAYNSRLRTSLGQAVLQQRRVELNTRLLQAHPDQLIPTLIHELAHVAVHMRYGRVPPHGRHFRVLMAAMAMNAKATHNLPTARLIRQGRRKFLYVHKCSDCGYSFVACRPRRDCYCRRCGPDMAWSIIRVLNNQQGKQTPLRGRRQTQEYNVLNLNYESSLRDESRIKKQFGVPSFPMHIGVQSLPACGGKFEIRISKSETNFKFQIRNSKHEFRVPGYAFQNLQSTIAN